VQPSAGGADENSPQFQLRERSPKNQSSPGGAADKIVAGSSVAPPGLVIVLTSRPAVETAGYFQLSLRDEASRCTPLRDIIRLTAG